jgi:hypothetical protein
MGNIDPSLLSGTGSQPGKDIVTVENDISSEAKRKQRFIALANAMVL